MQENLATNKRIDWLDFAKGIGAFLVVLGHVSSLNHDLILAIYSFHMPLFFILSGYVYKNKPNFKKHFLSKFKGIFLPFLVADLIDIVRVIVRQNVGFASYSLKDVICKFLFFDSEPIINMPIWFLVVLFEVELVYYFVYKAKTIQKFCLLVVIIALSAYFDTAFYFGLGISLRALIFFIIGDLLKNVNLNSLNKKQVLGILVSFLIIVPLWWKTAIDNKFVNLFRVSSGDSYFAYLFCAIVGSMVVIMISIFVGKISVVNYLGKQSLYLLICQNWFWSLYKNCIYIHIDNEKILGFLDSKIKGAFTIAVGITIASLIVSYPVSKYRENKRKKLRNKA